MDEKPQLPANKSRGKIFIEDMFDLKPEDAFRLDREPDLNNITYQSVYKLHIAKYHRVGSSVLGMSNSQAISYAQAKHKRHGYKRSDRYYRKDNRKKKKDNLDDDDIVIDMSSHSAKTPSRFNQQSVETTYFIPVESEDRKERSVPSRNTAERNDPSDPLTYNPLGVYDKATSLYIQGKTLDKSGEHSENQSNVVLKEPELHRVQRRTAEYNKHLRENPGDVQKWLEFIDFQEEALLVKEKEKDVQEKKSRIDKVVLEIRISILEKALEKNPASIELKIKQLTLCSEIWDSKRLQKVCV